jgi:Family of unknown function (DUF6941)
MLLCDAAEEIDGTLNVRGGGWSRTYRSGPIAMALAVAVALDWDQADGLHHVRAALITEDGEPVDIGEGPVQVESQFDVPGGGKAEVDTVLVLDVGTLSYPAGNYVWQLFIDDVLRARVPCRVRSD